jgi:hypothetical protein
MQIGFFNRLSRYHSKDSSCLMNYWAIRLLAEDGQGAEVWPLGNINEQTPDVAGDGVAEIIIA